MERSRDIKIGILALQGAFLEHFQILKTIPNVIPVQVRTKEDLDQVDALIIPGGESTSMGIIAERSGLIQPLKDFTQNKPTWVLIAIILFLFLPGNMCWNGHACKYDFTRKKGGQPLIGGLDAVVDRNYFGSQMQAA